MVECLPTEMESAINHVKITLYGGGKQSEAFRNSACESFLVYTPREKSGDPMVPEEP